MSWSSKSNSLLASYKFKIVKFYNTKFNDNNIMLYRIFENYRNKISRLEDKFLRKVKNFNSYVNEYSSSDFVISDTYSTIIRTHLDPIYK